MSAVEVNMLCKSYGTVKALKDISLSVSDGAIFGFIGPDGAGKTTLFRILTTLILPDSGTAKVLGLDCINDFRKIRLKLGYMPGRFSLYHDLTVEENLRFFASIFGSTIKENYHLIKDIYSQIEPFKDRKAGKLSGGMKQKLALSCALIHKPELLLLDEPTTGVDAVSRKEFWDMLLNLQKQGISIIVSTPYMDEANLCDEVALIQNGRILEINTPDSIVASFPHKLFAVRTNRKYETLSLLKEFENCYAVYAFGEFLHYIDKNPIPNLPLVADYLQANSIKDFSITESAANIEDSFMELMKRQND